MGGPPPQTSEVQIKGLKIGRKASVHQQFAWLGGLSKGEKKPKGCEAQTKST